MNLPTLVLAGALCIAASGHAQIEPALQARIDGKLQEVVQWAADPVIVGAVRAQNAGLPPERAGLTQDKWRTLTVLDPIVRAFTKSPAGQFLKSHKGAIVAEAFLSDAAGLKVAFLTKTSSWSHLGKPKHDVPLTGKTWQGAVEVDESSGQQQVQIAVPVMDGGKPIGSLVVGLSINNLKT